MTKRTDPHRPGAIVPADYSPVLVYNGASSEGGMPIPSFNVNCELERRPHAPDGDCCVLGLLAKVKFAATGSTGKCSVCGAHFVYGEVWKHEPTGEHVHLGHDCAAKYDLVANTPEWSAKLAMLKRRRAATVEHLMRDKREDAFCARVPGLASVLHAVAHPIVADLRGSLRSWGSLSEKQVELAFKIAWDAYCPERPKVEEVHVKAPEGRAVVEGKVVSLKVHDSAYGSTLKMTVKVATPGGTWLCWGTALEGVEVGQVVKFRATLSPGKDAHFSFFKRPHDLREVAA